MGNESVEGSLEALKYLRSQNKRLFFVTNSSIRDRQELQNRFTKFGLKVDLNEVLRLLMQCYPSTYMAGLYIAEKHPEIRKVLAFGSHYLVK